MEQHQAKNDFIEVLKDSLQRKSFVKLTLSKTADKNQEVRNIYVRTIELKNEPHLSFTYHYANKDTVDNHRIEEGVNLIATFLGKMFLNADLFTTEKDIRLKYNRKRVPKLMTQSSSFSETPSVQHDRQKKRFIEATKENVYLRSLGITDQRGEVIKSMQDKFKQINKFIEIIDSLITETDLPPALEIVDMGCGKGYLTFALYDYLNHHKHIKTKLTGIEQHEKLVNSCQSITNKAGFNRMTFIRSRIDKFNFDKTDMLIALHACDTATDDAIFKGIKSEANWIIVAPCCHKQIRKEMNCSNPLSYITQYGILEERMAEMVTDTLRALVMEANGYKTKIFEFVSTGHTAKNIMITGEKSGHIDKSQAAGRIEELKKTFGIENFYLQEKLAEKQAQ